MNMLIDWLEGPLVASFVLALLHSLWQGLLWFGVLGLLLRLIPSRRPERRYNAGLSCLALLLLTFLVTWSWIDHALVADMAQPIGAMNTEDIAPANTASSPEGTTRSDAHPHSAAPADDVVAVGSEVPSVRTQAERQTSPSSLRSWLPWLALTWMAGCLWMLLRGILGIVGVRQLVRSTRPADAKLLDLLAATCRKFGMSTQVRLVLTDHLNTPAVWGIVRPVLLLPATLATSLSAEQIEAIFAHELAHIRRWDPLVHLLQVIVECGFFFNPAVWWIGREIRRDREACCDALA
ncbi:MAG: M56 family metallopeptidase, partial [Planctomycetaceae bacterium]|nr:M56 family metallopeptidase [Planctomycetaceae bacterium]